MGSKFILEREDRDNFKEKKVIEQNEKRISRRKCIDWFL